MPVAWIEHRGKQILRVDLGRQTVTEMIGTLVEETNALRGLPDKALVLVDAREAISSQQFLQTARRIAVQALIPRIERQAILGVDGVRRIMLQTFNVQTGGNLVAFATETEALDYLTN